MAFGRWVASLTATSVLALASPVRAAIVDPAFTEELVATLPRDITSMEWATDGSKRLFVLLKAGTVRVVEDGVLLPTPFATFEQIYTNSECGLLGVAFDPNFIDNGFVYFFVTVSATEQQIIRYTADGSVGRDPTVILRNLPTAGINHNGGALGFGPDGKLYWAIGDNGTRTGIQKDLLSLASKVGRANSDGSVPLDNPFVDGAGLNNDYIWAQGFRNPFTMAWQPATGQLWLNVVGSFYEQVFTPKAGDNGGWNLYESNQPAGFLKPVISYATNTFDELAIPASGASRVGGVATFTLDGPHRLRPGAKINIVGVADATFDGVHYVADVSDSTFTVSQGGTDATSGGGTASSERIGGCITGATFWDSSGVPAAYRGNFFFTEYTFGRIMRAQLSAASRVTAVDEWANQLTRVVDLTIGPDGDLYYVRLTGTLYRARYAFNEQAIVVSKLNARLAEGGKAAFSVRLTSAPTAPRRVTIGRVSGDTDVSVLEGTALLFGPDDYAVPQRVILAAAADRDSVEDVAAIRVSSPGVVGEVVSVKVTDDDAKSILVDPEAGDLAEGASFALSVALSEPPPANQVVTVSVEGDGVITTTQQLTFTPRDWSRAQLVTIQGVQDEDLDDEEAKVVLASAGFGRREVGVTVRDDDPSPPAFETLPIETAMVGAPYRYDADASGRPVPRFSLTEAPSGMVVEADSGVVTWNPTSTGVVAVSLQASNGREPAAVQAFDVLVVDDMEQTGGAGGAIGVGSGGAETASSAGAAALGLAGAPDEETSGGVGGAPRGEAASGQAASEGGTGDARAGGPTDEGRPEVAAGDCSCRVPSGSESVGGASLLAIALGLGLRRRRATRRRHG
jgi:glucose/arabinose dehydrogenase